MTKKDFGRRMILSSALTAAAIALILAFCVLMFHKYSKPSEENTSTVKGTVADVYYAVGLDTVIVKTASGDALQLVYPGFSRELYAAIGYDLDGLHALLVDREIEYRKMDRLSWIVEIRVDGAVIDNSALTAKQILATRVGIVILGLIMLAFVIAGEAVYVGRIRRLFKKAEKKRARRVRRSLRKTP